MYRDALQSATSRPYPDQGARAAHRLDDLVDRLAEGVDRKSGADLLEDLEQRVRGLRVLAEEPEQRDHHDQAGEEGEDAV